VIFIYIAGLVAMGLGIVHSLVFGNGENNAELREAMILLVLAWFLLMGGITLAVCSFSRRKIAQETTQSAFDNAPENKENVKVISKSYEIGGIAGATGTFYYIAFEFSDKTRKTFEVDVTEYALVAENERGILTYKEYGDVLVFIDFQSQA